MKIYTVGIKLVLFAICSICCSAILLTAQTKEPASAMSTIENAVKENEDGQYILNGHKFIVNSKLGSPFIETFILNKLGYGRTINLDVPSIRISGTEVVQVEGELLFTTLNFKYQQEIRDWMAFNANVEVIGRLGDQAGTLISEGINVGTIYELGLLMKLYESKKLFLSGGLSIGNSEVTVINLQEFIEEIIDSGRITADNRLVQNVPIFRGGVEFVGAYAFNKVFGATWYLEYLLGETFSRDQGTDSFFNYGFGFDADLNPAYNVPLGFLVGFYANEFPDAADKLQRDPINLLFQINYTGESDLNLGLEFSYQIYKPVDFEKNINFLKTEFGLKYYF